MNEKILKIIDSDLTKNYDQTMLSNIKEQLKKHDILSYYNLDRKTYNNIKKYAFENDNIKLPEYVAPLSYRTIKIIGNNYIGWQGTTHIFIDPYIKQEKLLLTTIHELTHMVDDANDHYKTPDDIFYNEFNADLQCWYVQNPGKKLTRSKYNKLKEYIIEQYGLNENEIHDNDIATLTKKHF